VEDGRQIKRRKQDLDVSGAGFDDAKLQEVTSLMVLFCSTNIFSKTL
jgi:hypothetical protein